MIIGLQGYAGSGKSTVAQYLATEHGFARRHIKAPISSVVWTLLYEAGVGESGLDWIKYTDGELKNDPIPQLGGRSGRDLQQFLGTEFGRNFIHPDIWLDIWSAWAAQHPKVVQESVRFANEAERCDVIWEVSRPGYGALNGHVSEALPAVADVVLDNSGGVEALYEQIDREIEKGA